jgi:hypothetical protein
VNSSFFITVECVNNKRSEESNEGKVHIGLLILLVVVVLCFLLSLGVNIYQRRLIQSNSRQPCHQSEVSENSKQEGKFDTHLNSVLHTVLMHV